MDLVGRKDPAAMQGFANESAIVPPWDWRHRAKRDKKEVKEAPTLIIGEEVERRGRDQATGTGPMMGAEAAWNNGTGLSRGTPLVAGCKGAIAKAMGRETMKTVYSASNMSLVSIFRDNLESYGINCWIKNEFLSAGVGEIPPIECWPQLCVDDDDYEEAKRIVDEALAKNDRPVWQCAACGEVIEGQFTECWNCGKSRTL